MLRNKKKMDIILRKVIRRYHNINIQGHIEHKCHIVRTCIRINTIVQGLLLHYRFVVVVPIFQSSFYILTRLFS